METLPFEGACVLVLGNGARAQRARALLVDAGATLASRFGREVTYVVIDRSVPSGDPAIAAARAAAVPVLTTAELQEHPAMAELATVVRAPSRGVPPLRSRPNLPVRPVPGPAVPPPPSYRPVPPRVTDLNGFDSGLGWSLAPFLTGGLATPFVTGYAAAQLRSRFLAMCTLGYLGAWLVTFSAVFFGQTDLAVMAGVFTWLTNWLGGSAHAFVLGRRIRESRRAEAEENALPGGVAHPGNAAALAGVAQRRRLRAEARTIVDNDLAAARELGIGRPDLPRRFDDGGLIDVNSAPIAVLRRLPGVDAQVAEAIVHHRETDGPFETTAEVVLHTTIDPRKVDQFDELAVYLI